jgi:thiosulfate/3-mercaptopyruvate sulfurtransferase
VVIVGGTANPVDQCFRTRVAWTLIYAGVKNVSLLDGGIEKWQHDKRAVSTEFKKPEEAECKGNLQKHLVVSKEQLIAALGNVTVVDTRPADFFFGVAKAPTVAKPGHINGAVCLPSPGWILDSEGMMKKTEELAAIAEGVVGSDHAKEIMTYCNTGVFASGWWYFLSEVLGYKDVKLYDGSMEELAKDPNAPIVKYTWK